MSNKNGYIYLTVEKNSDGAELMHYDNKKIGLGRTNDISRRFREHASRGSKATVGVEFIEFFDCDEIGIPDNILETRLHDILENIGYIHIDRTSLIEKGGEEIISSTEVFSGVSKTNIEEVVSKNEQLSINLIKRIIRNISNVDLFRKNLVLKPHQIEANNFINKCFASDDKRCLLAHKPRSGKTFTTIYNIKENNYKNVVILTSYPILNFQWRDVIYWTRGFSDINIIIGSGLSKIELSEDKNNIVLLSLQDVKGGEEVFEKEKFDLIKDIKWDLLVIDEVHYGVETSKTEDFLSKIKFERMLGLSATPSKNLICGRFSPNQIHSYTLVEENKLKNQYPHLYPYADIEFLLWNLSGSEKSELKYFSDDEQFKFDKFFRLGENGEFYYKSDIIYLFKKLIGDRSICGRDKLGTMYPFKNNGTFSEVKSILLFAPNIQSQKKLKELLDEMDSYSSDFNIHITNSEEYSSKQLMNMIQKDFKSTLEKRSLIIAVDQLTTGITLEDCDMVVLMNDWRSVDKYVQSSFRCQSPREGKSKCFVVDFNAARSFELIWEYQNIISKNNGKSVSENVREWIECVNIFNRVDGELKKVDFDTFNNEYNKVILEKPRFNYNSVIYFDKLKLVERELSAIGLKGVVSKTEKELDSDGGIDSGKSKEGVVGGSVSVKEKSEEEVNPEKLMEVAKALVDKTMLLSIFTYFRWDNIDDCFRALENDNTLVDGIGALERDMYLETLLLGINDSEKFSLGIIKKIYDTIFDKEIINKKLYLFKLQWNSIYNIIRENPNSFGIMIEKAIELINSYLKPSTTEKRLMGEVFTPLYGKPGCVENQLNLMTVEFWENMNAKVLDPCAGIGNYSVVLVEKFMKGLENKIINSEERLKWILEKIIYVNEYQSKNLFIYLQLFDPENKYKMNFNRGDYLTLDIKKTFGVNLFDLICMNSPYQELDGGNGGSSKPLYNLFIEKAIKDSKCVISINPNRWFSGGKGLDNFRKMMLNRKDLKTLNYIDDEKLVFGNSVSISGGVSYFLIDENYCGETNVNGNLIDLSKRDVLIIDEKINSIISKVMSDEFKSFQDLVLSRNPFGIDGKNWVENGIKVITKDGVRNTNIINDKFNILNKYKLLISKANGNAFTKKKYITNYKILYPGEASSETYLVCGVFDNEIETINAGEYLLTKFARFLLSLRMSGQNNSREKFYFIPVLDFNKKYTDDDLYNFYKLSKDEIDLIEKLIK